MRLLLVAVILLMALVAHATDLPDPKDHEFSYDADHAFANPSGDRFDSATAKDAWHTR